MDLTDSYAPPAVPDSAGGISYLYDKDKKLLSTVFSDSTSIQMVYDTTFAGSARPSKIIYDQGSTSFDYDSTTGNLTSVVSSDSVVTNYSYDGSLTIQIAASGPVNGTMNFTYNNDFQVTSQSINGANTVGFSYDDDGLLVGAGALSMSYDLQNGLLNSTSVGNVSGSYGYNSLGELTGSTYRYNTSTIFDRSYGLDSLGRITSVTETIGGETETYEYTYNSIGYLVEEKVNGVVTAEYRYDANGNRTAYIAEGDTTIATYDEQDRMLAYGDASYSYGPRGDLQRKIVGTDTTSYNYDNVGNLRSVVLSDGTAIEYIIDGQDRRIGKKVNGQLVKRWLYTTGLMPVAELDSAGNVHVEYGPGYFVKNDTTYRILRDHIGSVRLIVNIATGNIVQDIEYDAFGRITSTLSNDKFLDFTFAGGLYDPDTGLIRFGARDYDASTGRWTTKDPILFNGRQSNLYIYVNNNPVNFIDPNGQFAWVVAGAVIGAAINVGATLIANGGDVSWQQVGAAAASGAISGAIGAVAGPLGGSLARGVLGTASNSLAAAVAASPISAVGGYAGQKAANWIDPCNAENPFNAALWSGLGGGFAKGKFSTQNLNTWEQARDFGPKTFQGLFGSSNAWLNHGSVATSSGVGAASYF